MSPVTKKAALSDVTNAVPEAEGQSVAAGTTEVFKHRPETLATFARKKRLDQAGCTGVLQATDWALKPAADQAAAAEKPSGRKGKGIGKSASKQAGAGVRAALPAVNAESDAPSATTDKAANSPPPSQAARQPDVGGRRYPRKVAPSAKQHEADAGAHFLAAMRAHFQEVDAFDLAVETPSPAAPVRRQASPPTAEAALPPAGGQPLIDRLAAAAAVQDAPASSPGKPGSPAAAELSSLAGRARHSGISFGLSRRRSSMVSHPPPPHRYGTAGTGTTLSAAPDAAEGEPCSAAAAGQPAPAARSSFSDRMSIEAGLSRLSLGFTSALQRFGFRSSGTGAEVRARAEDAALGQQATVRHAAAVSPIVESPEAQSGLGTPSTGGPADDVAAAAAVGATQPASTGADSNAEAGEVFISPLPASRADLRAADEDLYASPESPSALSRTASNTSSQGLLQPDAEPPAAAAATGLPLSVAKTVADASGPTLGVAASTSAGAAVADAQGAAAGVAAVLLQDAAIEAAAAQLARVSLVAEEEGQEAAQAAAPLEQLLRLCGQPRDVQALPSMTQLLSEHVDLESIGKVGEGTFGEAFKAEGVVFKIVPLDGELLVNGEVQKRASDIVAEVDIAIQLSRLRGDPGAPPAANATAAFVEMHGVGVCRGRYAPALVAEWHAWDARHGSENDAPDAFPDDQLYVVFVVADGGVDLEHFELRSLDEAKSILLQVALAVGVAEEACQFEHRDLHWGNLLIRRGAPATASYRFRGVDTKAKTGGLAVTLIDFTLSRLTMPGAAVAFCDLSADPELFAGPKGDCQADTYRRMQKLTKGDWAAHTPATNAVWLGYLTDAMLSLKQAPLSAQAKRHLRAFKKRALAGKSCAELIFDEYFDGLWSLQK